jgi:type II secretory pathway component PulF
MRTRLALLFDDSGWTSDVALIPPAISTEQQLVALNDELLALVRAGIPLDRGLQLASQDMPGQLRRITQQLGRELEQGRSLEEALARQPETFPAAYRALVLAGMKTGQLPRVLASIAESMKRLESIRRTMRSSLAYPLIIIAVAYVCFLAFTRWATPPMVSAYWDLVHRDEWALRGLLAMSDTVQWWWPLPPVIGLGIWMVGSRATGFSLWKRSVPRWRTPWRRLEHLGNLAIFSEILALLVEQEEPLPSALVLAADVTGSTELGRDSRQLADRLAAGQPAAGSLSSAEGLTAGACPQLLSWLLLSSRSSRSLTESLHRFSRAHQRQAERLAMTLSFFYPVILGTLLAGMAVLAYAIWVTLPWYMLLYRLGDIG